MADLNRCGNLCTIDLSEALIDVLTFGSLDRVKTVKMVFPEVYRNLFKIVVSLPDLKAGVAVALKTRLSDPAPNHSEDCRRWHYSLRFSTHKYHLLHNSSR